jgi:prophage DNA circulation protein
MTELLGAPHESTGAWVKGLQPASFRGVPFHVDGASGEFGRRSVTHEFPGRDTPASEDLGRRARQFTLECFVLGADYMAQRDALLAACEREGPGGLVHPYLGHVTVQVGVVRVRESTREGGLAAISLTCTETGALRFPSARRDTAAGVATAAAAARQSALQAFIGKFKAAGRAVARAQRAVEQALETVEQTVAGITSTAADLIRTPAELALAVSGAITRIATLIDEPFRALALYKGLFGAGGDPTPPYDTDTRAQAGRNTAAVNALVRRSAVIEACATAAEISGYGSSADALAVQGELVDALDGLLGATDPVDGSPSDDDALAALLALRGAVVEDLSARAAELPRVVRFTPPVTVPALALAQRLYGDPAREAEIVARNRVAHPGFVPGGIELEVLRDAV